MNIQTPVATCFGDWVDRHLVAWKEQVETLKVRFSGAISEVMWPRESATDVPILYVDKNKIIDVLTFLKTEAGFEYGFLADLTATDEGGEHRFEVVYNLMSRTQHARRIRVKVKLRENEECPTLCGVWKGANWLEREVFDMFGIRFKDHPDLRRILMDERWVGYPLRKDYPLRGYQIFPTPMEANLSALEKS